MDTSYVITLVRQYGTAVRERQPRRQTDQARDAALAALAESGASGDMPGHLARYARYNHTCGDHTLDHDERGTAGHRAIDILTLMEGAVRRALREPPPRPATRTPSTPGTGTATSGVRDWTIEVQRFTAGRPAWVYESVENWAAVGRPRDVAARYVQRRDLDDQHRVRVWHGPDADTDTRPAIVWPPRHRQ